MGGRGTFGTKQDPIEKRDILIALNQKGVKVTKDGRNINNLEALKKLTHNEVAILNLLQNKLEKNQVVSFTDTLTTKNGKIITSPIVKTKRKITNAQGVVSEKSFVMINSSMAKRGVKYVNKILKDEGYRKGLRSDNIMGKPKPTL